MKDGLTHIRVRGAREHNLKGVNVDIPRNELVVITGLSGSGKSSLAFDTIYPEGQRRYVESLSAYARQFLELMQKPDVDSIEGLSPAISIEQKTTSRNPRSTVGTVTEIYDYMRLLWARVGTPYSPATGLPIEAMQVAQMVDRVMALREGTRLYLLAPIVRDRKGEYRKEMAELLRKGYQRAKINGEFYELSEAPKLDKKLKHDIEVVIDRIAVKPGIETRLADSLEQALRLADGIAYAEFVSSPAGAGGKEAERLIFSQKFACPVSGFTIPEIEPRLFSFNNPVGACPDCDGLGVKPFIDPARVVSDPTLPLPAGAIHGWDRTNPFYFQMLESLARHYKFDLRKPFEELPARIRKIVLHGSGEEEIVFTYDSGHGATRRQRHPFEGVIPNFDRRLRETSSDAVREELARMLSNLPCEECGGARLRREARHVFITGRSLPEITRLSIAETLALFRDLRLPGARGEIAARILHEVVARLGFLVNVGLDYLTLARSADTLSGGEAQRIRLASQIGAGLQGVLYVLDEPSIGLHARDNARLLTTLKHLRDTGNTVIVVEHDEEAIRAADHLLDMGPGAGQHGGEVVAQGTPAFVAAHPRSLTGAYLRGDECIAVPAHRTPNNPMLQLAIRGARGNNLHNLDVSLPVGLLTCVTGVSGSGKSTLINDTLYAAAARRLYGSALEPAACKAIEGLDHFDKVVDIDQSPIGRTPRSNPATYTGLFSPIRDLYAATPHARERGYGPGRFSFNVRGGRCEACEGEGLIRVEMHFLPDVYVPCDICKGARYNRETLEIRYKGKTISETLAMTVEEAREFFGAVPVLARKLDTLTEVGLSYLTLGQSATTLSGGEAQRIKLSRELSRRDTGRTLYILDEPTTGLHFHDIKQLLAVLHRLRDHGNTVVVIEHNLDVIKTADWIVDLGPEGGDGGGQIVAEGTPEEVAERSTSYTGKYLKPFLARPVSRVAAR